MVADHSANVGPEGVPHTGGVFRRAPHVHDEGVELGRALTHQPRVGYGREVAGKYSQRSPVHHEYVVVFA